MKGYIIIYVNLTQIIQIKLFTMLNLTYEGTATWALSVEYKPHSICELRITNQQTGAHISPFVTLYDDGTRTHNISVAHATDRIISRWSEQEQSVIKQFGYINKDNKLYLYLQPARYIYKIGDETGFITIFDNSNSKTYEQESIPNKVYNG